MPPEEASPNPVDDVSAPPPAAVGAPPADLTERIRHRLRWLRPGSEVTWLVLLALAVRAVGWLLRPAIPADAADLILSAESVQTGGAAALRELPHHPLTVWLLSRAPRGSDLELWGAAGAALCSSLAIAPLHVLARAAGGRHAATFACLLYAVLPKFVSVGSVALTEALLLPLALAALAFAFTAGVSHGGPVRMARPILAGVAAGLAYLARPEGLAVIGLTALAAGVRARRPDRLRAAALVLLAALLLAGPWVAEMSSAAGHLVLSPKKDLARFAGLAAAPLADDARAGAAIRALAAAFGDALGPALAFVVVGIVPLRRWRRKRSRRPRILLLAGAALLAALLLRLATGWGYAGGRHALLASSLLLPFAGQGLVTLFGFFSRAVRRRRAALVLTGWMAVPLAVVAVLRPDGESGERERLLGEAVARTERERGGGDVVVASYRESLVAYYADRALRPDGRRVRHMRLLRDHGALIEMSPDLDGKRADLAAALRDRRADWMVLRLWGRSEEAERGPGDVLAARLLEDGVLGTPALGASELAAFPVRR